MSTTLFVSNQTGRPFRLETAAEGGGEPWEPEAISMQNTSVAPGEGGTDQTQVPVYKVDRGEKIKHGKTYFLATTVLTSGGAPVCRLWLKLTGTLLGSDIEVDVTTADGSQGTGWFGDGARSFALQQGQDTLKVGASYLSSIGDSDVLLSVQFG